MIRTISILLFGCGLSMNVLCRERLGRDEYTRTFDKTLTVQNAERISLEHRFGDIVVHTHPQQDVVIHAVRFAFRPCMMRMKPNEYADRVEILVGTFFRNCVHTCTRYPEVPKSFLGMHNVSFSVHYDLTIPESSPLQVRNAFGGVFVSGLQRQVPTYSLHMANSSFRTARESTGWKILLRG